MSCVTDVLVLCSLEERFDENEEMIPFGETPAAIQALNRWLKQNGHGELSCLDKFALGGGKAFQAVLYGAAFNYFPFQDFMKVVEETPWRERESVQVLIKDENGSVFTVHKIGIRAAA